jgi:LmbE family N-acetylglucosaminyl deacetylase
MARCADPLVIACARDAAAGKPAATVLVVSPHPDDDVLGVGGTMALLADAGQAVYAVYMTDGASPEDPLAGRRRREAISALRVVGGRGGYFLRMTGDDVRRRAMRAEAVRRMRAVLDGLAPGAVYCPAPFERHPTHIATASVTIEALRRGPTPAGELWGYSVWSGMAGLPGTRTVDITAVAGRKRRAIAKHASQLQIKPYHRGMLGRNRYEGVYGHTHDRRHCAYAEVLLDMRALLGPRPPSLPALARRIMRDYLHQIHAQ